METMSRADRYERIASEMFDRATTIRDRMTEVDDVLEPLRKAMARRACELELSATALSEIADGQRQPLAAAA